MPETNHKAVRRAILELLYQTYLDDPLCMVEPEVFFQSEAINRKSIVPNMHYLADRKLVEMMMGYCPPMFSAVRITARGMDLVENRFEFNLQFPAAAREEEQGLDAIPWLLERLVEEGDFAPIDGIGRRQLLGDILYLRGELSLPRDRWRIALVRAVIEGVDDLATRSGHPLPALAKLAEAVNTAASTGF